MSATLRLKPCPFCGSKNLDLMIHHSGGYFGFVYCLDCANDIPPKFQSVNEAEGYAAERWNRRTDAK